MNKRTFFEEADIKAFEPEAKIGLLATLNPEGWPHLTFLSSMRAKDHRTLMFGQFTEGLSKVHVRDNPRTGFLIMTPDKRLWRGKARWTHSARQGEDFEMYNNQPMFRYNAYFGINTVHYLDLVETGGRENLPMAAIIAAAVLTRLARTGPPAETERILKPWAEDLFNKMGALKFLAWVDRDGFPKIVPVVQGQAWGSRGLVFSAFAYGPELSDLTPGLKVAVFGLFIDNMEDVLVRGEFAGFSRRRGLRIGRVDLDWVYNAMPPKQGQIYPVQELKPVVNF
ncbi:MAG: pyridoxamine 5'-phosphate oxidase family protein [Thermodesulfobacteriota bacterium]